MLERDPVCGYRGINSSGGCLNCVVELPEATRIWLHHMALILSVKYFISVLIFPIDVIILVTCSVDVIHWSEGQVMDWVQSCSQEHGLQVDPSLFRMNGAQLCQMTQQQFCQLTQVKQSGDILYTCLEKLRSGINKSKFTLSLLYNTVYGDVE